MEESPVDKRKSRRVPYIETITVNDSLEVHCNDISEGGLFVHMNKALLPGSVVTVKFPDTPVKFEAVVQVVPGTGGVGLMFTNMEDAHRAALKEIIAGAEKATSEKATTPTVLMVESSDSVRRLNRAKLEAEGFTVLEATDGMEALKVLNTRPPDVVILEMEAKRVDGYGVIEFLQSSPALKDVPVIAISSVIRTEDQAKVLEAGASVFLPKSTTPPAKLASITKKMYTRAKSASA
jgi:two-component system chemotaxis response regulator CheY